MSDLGSEAQPKSRYMVQVRRLQIRSIPWTTTVRVTKAPKKQE